MLEEGGITCDEDGWAIQKDDVRETAVCRLGGHYIADVYVFASDDGLDDFLQELPVAPGRPR